MLVSSLLNVTFDSFPIWGIFFSVQFHLPIPVPSFYLFPSLAPQMSLSLDPLAKISRGKEPGMQIAEHNSRDNSDIAF